MSKPKVTAGWIVGALKTPKLAQPKLKPALDAGRSEGKLAPAVGKSTIPVIPNPRGLKGW